MKRFSQHSLITFLAICFLVSSCRGEGDPAPHPPESALASPQTNACDGASGHSIIATTDQMSAFANPLCVSWRDSSPDEDGFVVSVRFLQTAERFEHALPADSTAFTFPEEEQPNCARGAYQVEVRVFKKGVSEPFSGFAAQSSCGP